MSCCNNPTASDLSYSTFVFPEHGDGAATVERRTHIYCHTCGAHLYGKPGNEPRLIQKAEWEAGLSAMLGNW